ncbi:AcrR family transcriptional regulator [Bradyrhizobium sp. i1.3.6]
MTKKPTKAVTPTAARADAKGRAPADAAPASNRATRAAERRSAIVEAAMEEFIARGFAATRLDDIAKRAGVAKGTIYLHFKDKESMFEELVRTVIVPVVA